MADESLPPVPAEAPISVRRPTQRATIPISGSDSLPSVPVEAPSPPQTMQTTRRSEDQVIGPDIARSAAAGLPLGVSQMVGLPGTLKEAAISHVVPSMIGIGASAVERLGYISPAQKQEISERGKQFPEMYRKLTGSSRPSEKTVGFELPTVAQAEKFTKEYLPFSDYEPKTTYGKYAKAAAEGAGAGAVGPLKFIPSGMGIGTASGLGSEFGSQVASDASPLGKMGAQVAGAFAGGLGGAKIANLVREFAPNITGSASTRVYQAIAEDIASGQSKLTIDQINEAIRSGQPITLADVAGPKALSIIETYGARSPQSFQAIGKFFEETTPRQLQAASPRDAERGKRFESFRDEYATFPVTGPELEAAVSKIGSDRRQNIYSILRQDPAAQNISANNFDDLYMKPEFRKAVDDAMDSMANAPKSWGIEGKRSPVTFTAKNTGEKFNPVDGNLSFYDHVKRSLDEEITRIKSSPKDSALYSPTRLSYLEDIRDNLVRRLDSIVPSYKTTRSSAAETFRASNAVEAGYNFLAEGTKPGRKLVDEISRKDLVSAFNSFTPQEQFLFKTALLDRISSVATDQNTFNAFAKAIAKPNEHFPQSLKAVLGDSAFERLRDRTMVENVLSNVSSVVNAANVAGKNPGMLQQVMQGGAKIGALGAGGNIAYNVMNDLIMLNQIGTSATVGGAAAITGAVYSLVEGAAKKEMSKVIVPLMMSGDPKDLAKLQQIMRTGAGSETVADIMAKTQALAAAAGRAVEGYDQFNGRQSGQASGGRVARASGGRIVHEDAAEKLIRAAEIAKNSIGKQTETILEKPDEHVVQALAVANRHI